MQAGETLRESFSGTTLNLVFWNVADGWGNGDFTSTFWLAEQASLEQGQLVLTLDGSPCVNNHACEGKANAGAEARTRKRWGNDSRVSASMRAARGEGLITALFKYTGPYDGDPHDEVDIEILGKYPTKAQLNYWVGGESRLEKMIDLGFDATRGFHTYGWVQTPTTLTWMVDGKVVHRVTVEQPGELPRAAGKVMLSLWAAQPGSGADTQWAGDVRKTSLPQRAFVDWVRISAGATGKHPNKKFSQ